MSAFEAPGIGFIGAAGEHSLWSHLGAPVGVPAEHIVVLNDLHDLRGSEAHKRAPHAAITTDASEVFKNRDVQGVYIVSDDDTHALLTRGAVDHGKHPFTEKPMADDWESYQLLQETLYIAEQEGLRPSTCHPRRYDPPFVGTKELLDDRVRLARTFGLPYSTDLGSVIGFRLGLNYPMPQRPEKHKDFGFDHLGHEVDTSSHFFGFSGIKTVIARQREAQAFDVSAMRDDGIGLHFVGNRHQPLGHPYAEDWQITFESRSMLSVNAYSGEITLEHEGETISAMPTDGEDNLRFKTNYDKRFAALNAHFLRSIANPEQEPPYLTRQEMLMNTIFAVASSTVGHAVGISPEGNIIDR